MGVILFLVWLVTCVVFANKCKTDKDLIVGVLGSGILSMLIVAFLS